MRSIDDLDVHGRRVLVRVDFNVPLSENPDGTQAVADDTRIVAALPTIEELRARGARLILVSHLGRPKGERVQSLSMAPVAARLAELTGGDVTLAPDVVGPRVAELADALGDGQILRYAPDEADLLATERKVRALWAAIERALANREFPARRGRLCDWCAHQSLCPEFGGVTPAYPEAADAAAVLPLDQPTEADDITP